MDLMNKSTKIELNLSLYMHKNGLKAFAFELSFGRIFKAKACIKSSITRKYQADA